jgi:hypothetical protein
MIHVCILLLLLQDTRKLLADRLVAGLKEFRTLHAPHFRAHHRIIWPSSLRMLPLYMLGESAAAVLLGRVVERLSRIRPVYSPAQGCQQASRLSTSEADGSHLELLRNLARTTGLPDCTQLPLPRA